MTDTRKRCPTCGSDQLFVFYHGCSFTEHHAWHGPPTITMIKRYDWPQPEAEARYRITGPAEGDCEIDTLVEKSHDTADEAKARESGIDRDEATLLAGTAASPESVHRQTGMGSERLTSHATSEPASQEGEVERLQREAQAARRAWSGTMFSVYGRPLDKHTRLVRDAECATEAAIDALAEHGRRMEKAHFDAVVAEAQAMGFLEVMEEQRDEARRLHDELKRRLDALGK